MKCLATFDVTSMALMFEKQCRRAGFDVRIVPVPRQISASCGLACSYPCDRESEIMLRKGQDRNFRDASHGRLTFNGNPALT